MTGKLIEIRRFPVKSLLGESLSSIELEQRGIVGDRLWALRNENGKFGSGKTTRRFQRINGLFGLKARYEKEIPIITLPNGTDCRGDDPSIHALLSEVLGCSVTLSREASISHFDQSPISIVTTSSIRALSKLLGESVDPRRFRANFLLETEEDGFIEDEWINHVVQIGPDVRLRITGPIQRCVMVNHAQEDLSLDNRILRTLAKEHDANFGVYAKVEKGGWVEARQKVEFS